MLFGERFFARVQSIFILECNHVWGIVNDRKKQILRVCERKGLEEDKILCFRQLLNSESGHQFIIINNKKKYYIIIFLIKALR